MRSNQPGSHQLPLPIMDMMDGTAISRIKNASMITAEPRAIPKSLIVFSGVGINDEENAAHNCRSDHDDLAGSCESATNCRSVVPCVIPFFAHTRD